MLSLLCHQYPCFYDCTVHSRSVSFLCTKSVPRCNPRSALQLVREQLHKRIKWRGISKFTAPQGSEKWLPSEVLPVADYEATCLHQRGHEAFIDEAYRRTHCNLSISPICSTGLSLQRSILSRFCYFRRVDVPVAKVGCAPIRGLVVMVTVWRIV